MSTKTKVLDVVFLIIINIFKYIKTNQFFLKKNDKSHI